MAVIDLTLESFWIPAIPNYDTYRFGTKKQAGGLSTQEVNDNIMMPWERARPIEITDISTTKASGDTKAPVQADCSFVFTAGQRVSFTLDNADYVGCRATFYNTSAYIQDVRTLNSTDPNSPSYDTHTVQEGERIVLVWNGTLWQNISPTDTVAADNMNPVTSNAVATALGWQDFTPYSVSSNITNVKMYKRNEGGFVHYLFSADGVGTISIGQSAQVIVQLYQDKPITVVSRSAIAGNNYAGRVSVSEDYSTEDMSISKLNHYIWNAGQSQVTGWKLSFEIYTQE